MWCDPYLCDPWRIFPGTGLGLPNNANLVPVFFWFLTMKVELVTVILLVLIGLGYSFKTSDLLDDATFHETQRQSTVEDQILPVFGVAFMASLVNNVIFGTNTEKPMVRNYLIHLLYTYHQGDQGLMNVMSLQFFSSEMLSSCQTTLKILTFI